MFVAIKIVGELICQDMLSLSIRYSSEYSQRSRFLFKFIENICADISRLTN